MNNLKRDAMPKPPSAPPRNAKVPTPKLSPLVQSVVDQLTELEQAGKLNAKTPVTISVNGKDAPSFGGDQEYFGEAEADPNEAYEPDEEERGLLGVLPPSRGKIGVYDENGDEEPDEGSMLAEVLKAATKKAPTPPLRNSKGQIAVIRMTPGK